MGANTGIDGNWLCVQTSLARATSVRVWGAELSQKQTQPAAAAGGAHTLTIVVFKLVKRIGIMHHSSSVIHDIPGVVTQHSALPSHPRCSVEEDVYNCGCLHGFLLLNTPLICHSHGHPCMGACCV